MSPWIFLTAVSPLLILAALILGAALISEWIDSDRGRKQVGLFHRHRWRPEGVTHAITFTVVLQRCACGKTRTRTPDGIWTLEQLRGGS